MSLAGWLWQTIMAGPGRWDDKNNLVPYMATEILSTENDARASVFAHDDRFIFPPSSGYSNAFWDAENFDVKQ